MISFHLKCSDGHSFDSWFASGAACEKLLASGLVTCIDCGSPKVGKALMAPSVATERSLPGAGKAAENRAEPERAPVPTPRAPGGQMMAGLRALAALRRHVEETSDYVGTKFAAEVRAIDGGDAPERPIWGEVTAAESRALIDEGLPVAPLPFGPRSKAN